MAIKGKRSVGHLSSMFSVDKVLLGECSMLNTELVIAKIQKQIFHIPDSMNENDNIAGKTVT
jgi:hypothetical protein